MPSTTNQRALADEISDASLIKEIVLGNEGAFNSLVQRYKAKLFAFAVFYTRNEDVSLDIVQECFLRVFEKAHQYDPAFAVSTWLYKITLNLCRDYKRRIKRRSSFFFRLGNEKPNYIFPTNDDGTTHGSTLENLLSLRQKLNLLDNAIDDLPDDLKSALIMFHLEEQSQDECAEQLGISVKNVGNRVYRARKLLRKKIKPG